MDEVKAYMEANGFEWGFTMWLHTDTRIGVLPEAAELLYKASIASIRKTLEAVKQAGPGIKDVNIYTAQPIGGSPNFGCQREALGFNQANAEWNKTIDTMISALERKGE